MHGQQSGAVEACWAHNPEVRRSKLRSAKYQLFFFCYILGFFFITPTVPFIFDTSTITTNVSTCPQHDPLAQRIARWTSNPKVLGLIPRWVANIILLYPKMSGWPSGLRRQTQGSSPCSAIQSRHTRILVLDEGMGSNPISDKQLFVNIYSCNAHPLTPGSFANITQR